MQGLAGMYVGTIHGFCLDLLQRYLFQYLKYDVLDEVWQRLLVDRNCRKSGMASLGLKRWVESSLYLTILRVIREADADPAILEAHPVRDAWNAYQDLLDRHRYLDSLMELDDNSGKVVQAIRDLGIAEDTLVIWTTDNGAWVDAWPDAGLPRSAARRGAPMKVASGCRR